MTLVRVPWPRRLAEPWPVRIAVAVVLIDALLLSAHVLHRSIYLLDPEGESSRLLRATAVWNGGMDGSIMELFGLLQLGSAAFLFILLGLREPAHRVLPAWGAIFLLLIADDLFRVHERVGARLAQNYLAPPLGEPSAQELGGLVFWVVSGLLLGGGLIRQHRHSSRSARLESWEVLFTVVPFVVVAVGYVMFSVVRPDLVHGPMGEVAALARMAVKLLTMTLLLVQAMQLTTSRP